MYQEITYMLRNPFSFQTLNLSILSTFNAIMSSASHVSNIRDNRSRSFLQNWGISASEISRFYTLS